MRVIEHAQCDLTNLKLIAVAYKSTLFQSPWSPTALIFFQQRMNLWNRKHFCILIDRHGHQSCAFVHIKLRGSWWRGRRKGGSTYVSKWGERYHADLCHVTLQMCLMRGQICEHSIMYVYRITNVKKSIYMIRLFYPLVRKRVVLKYASFGTDSNFRPSHCQTHQQMEAKTSMWCAHQPKSSVFKLSTDSQFSQEKTKWLDFM